jgi:hypothetical protein
MNHQKLNEIADRMDVFITHLVYTIALGIGLSGFELGAKAGLYRVDERQESSAMTRHNAVPLKCYFVQCESQTLDLK